MSKKAVPNKTFRLSALAAAIMSINSMTAAAACTVTDGVVELDGISCENTEILDSTRVEMTGANPGLTNDGEIIGEISAKDSFGEALIETVLIEGGSGATVNNSGDIVADNLSADATAFEDIAIGIMISTDETDAGSPISLSDVTINNTGDVEAENPVGEGAVGIFVTPDTNDADAPLGTISNVTINNGSSTVTDSNIEASSGDEGAAGVLVLGEQVTSGVTISNKGAISAEGVRSFGVGLEDLAEWIDGGASATLTNSGMIGMIAGDGLESDPDYDPPVLAKVGVSIEDADADQYVVVNNEAGGKIVGTEIAVEVGAIDFETTAVVGAGKVDINNDGTIDGGEAGTGIKITGNSAVTITNTSSTTIKGNVGIESASTSTALDNYDAEGDEVGAGGYSVIVDNTGLISGSGGTAITQSGSAPMIIVNNGMIMGDINLITGSYLAMESGKVIGDLTGPGELDFEGGEIEGNASDLSFVGFDDESGAGNPILNGNISDVGFLTFDAGTGTVMGTLSGIPEMGVDEKAVAVLKGGGTVGLLSNQGRIDLHAPLTATSYFQEERTLAGSATIYIAVNANGDAALLTADTVTLIDENALGAISVGTIDTDEVSEWKVISATTLELPEGLTVEDLQVQGGGLYRFNACAGDSVGAEACRGDVVAESPTDIYFIADRIALTSVAPAGDSNTQELAAALEAAVSVDEPDGTLVALLDKLAELTPGKVSGALVEMTPAASVTVGSALGSVGGGAAAGGAAGGASKTVATRMSDIRYARTFSEDTGVNAGDAAAKVTGAWAQTFYNESEQGDRKGVDGYDADTAGITVGVDVAAGKNSTAGFAYSYARSDIEADSTPASTDLDTHAFTLYGSKSMGNQYVDAGITYAKHEFDGSRRFSAPLVGSAKADYDGDTWSINVGTGWTNELNRTWNFEPSVGLAWSKTSVDSYTETATGVMPALSVASDDIDALVAKLGATFQGKYMFAGSKFAPKIFANIYHDFEGDQPQANVAFAAQAGSQFTTAGAKPDKTMYEAGVGITGYQNSQVKLSGEYSYSTKDEFDGHTVSLTARWAF